MEMDWWKEGVVYQIYPRSFYDSNGDGIGDLKGIIEKLPYLKELGISLIWICPFYKSPMKDNGYDVEDYYRINDEFGTMEDMDRLLEAAGEMGMGIIIDMVLNHTSDRHEWFQKALKDRNSPYRNYYIFRDNIEGLADLRSIFGGPVWSKAPDGSYYFHTFATEQPDLNWDSAELKEELYRMLNWWLDKGVKGFRMDAITYIKKDMQFPSLEPDGPDGRTDVAKACLNQPGIGELLKELKEHTYGRYEAMTVAEAPGVPEEEMAEYIGKDGYFSMIFDFSYTDIDLVPGEPWYVYRNWSFGELKEKLFANQMAVQKTGWAANYLENHDQPRSIDKYFGGQDIGKYRYHMASALGVLFFFLRGTPFIYQGQELGEINGRFGSVDEFNDINTFDQYERAGQAGLSEEEALREVNRRSRDQGRLPLQWDESENGGFTRGTPWLGCNSREKITVGSQVGQENSVFEFYKKMISLRKNPQWKDTLIYGNIEEVQIGQQELVLYRRYTAAREILIGINLGEEVSRLPAAKDRVLLDNYGEESMINRDVLLPYEAAVWVNEK